MFVVPAAQNITKLGHLVSMYPSNVLLEGFVCLSGRNVTWPLIYLSRASKYGSEASRIARGWHSYFYSPQIAHKQS